jgi:hypothetical protein
MVLGLFFGTFTSEGVVVLHKVGGGAVAYFIHPNKLTVTATVAKNPVRVCLCLLPIKTVQIHIFIQNKI